MLIVVLLRRPLTTRIVQQLRWLSSDANSIPDVFLAPVGSVPVRIPKIRSETRFPCRIQYIPISSDNGNTVRDIAGKLNIKEPLDNANLCDLIKKCMERLDAKHIRNTDLNDFESIDDIAKFFDRGQEDASPYEKLIQSNDIPSNLVLMDEVDRFGIEPNQEDAFPDRDTVVSSLKYERKYKSNLKQHK